ncbi:MAG: ABC transporter ATP-binding protein [Methylococcales bacterium]|jgi:putative ABC transport system ATP-binding protein|nr:ABC transporter ATP-binding protein [Methylococcales bacterium]MBT3699033.1 ABC transporter ATP-binding protein [Methylococcales bacterium]MBT3815092.1 ABC transporter ATP-binding protein [Methylococcales bacterium]MBT4033063.1 ABC transporter ATP-binding protein [Methylococcales bacterium]MBT4599346.1 ABC transporter ATP-binding protein [Methylococcales bacterium]
MSIQSDALSETIIRAKNLSKTVLTVNGSLTILSGIHLNINRGESLAIMGMSGSGKTTLISLLAGLDTPSTGTITISGQLLTTMTEDDKARLRNQFIGFVFQNFQLLNNLTALENVMLPLEIIGHPHTKDKALNFLDRVGLSHRYHHRPSQLSGGEQQRVALARAFVTQPSILFADEPTGNLDQKTGKTIIDLLFALNEENKTTLVLVTHDQSLATLCSRTLMLENGKTA